MSNEIDIEKLALESQVSMEQCMGLKRDFRYGFHSTENLKQFAEAYYAERARHEGEVVAYVNTGYSLMSQPLRSNNIINRNLPVGTKLYTTPQDQTAEIERLKAEVEKWKGEAVKLTFDIDELMIEYCPEQMTKEQLESYERHQAKVSEVENE